MPSKSLSWLLLGFLIGGILTHVLDGRPVPPPSTTIGYRADPALPMTCGPYRVVDSAGRAPLFKWGCTYPPNFRDDSVRQFQFDGGTIEGPVGAFRQLHMVKR